MTKRDVNVRILLASRFTALVVITLFLSFKAVNVSMFGDSVSLSANHELGSNLPSTSQTSCNCGGNDSGNDATIIDENYLLEVDDWRRCNCEINHTSREKDCLPFNSQAWLTGKRLGNSAEGIDDYFVHRLIENAVSPNGPTFFRNLALQTLCHEQSNFANPGHWEVTNQTIDEWHFRLLYMSINYLFHAPAREEAKKRKSCTDHAEQSADVGRFDYECKDAKFLVAPFTRGFVGAGASFRNGVVVTIMNAIALGRIPILLNNIRLIGMPPILTKPSELTSCDRRDYQCFFLPLSPCTITAKELVEAVKVEEIKQDYFANFTHLTSEQSDIQARVVVVHNQGVVPFREVNNSGAVLTRRNLYIAATELIEGMKASGIDREESSKKWRVLQLAAERILERYTKGDDGYGRSTNYNNEFNPLTHAALLYFMRPNLSTNKAVSTIVQRLIPSHFDRNTSSLGLMLRGTDKCSQESTCLGAEVYRDMIGDLQIKSGAQDVIISSEDSDMLRSVMSSDSKRPINFIYNGNDTAPGSGKANHWKGRRINADDVIVSSLVVLKMQLHAGLLVGNCCSNFAMMAFDFIQHGCGLAKHGKTLCLQDHPEKRYRICCVYSKRAECLGSVYKLLDARRGTNMTHWLTAFNHTPKLDFTKLIHARQERKQQDASKG